jgi:glycosyltransferase involved in cell wall biosynthesis
VSNKELTIFIMAYNRPKYLKLALDSVINQTHKNITVIVSDNSTDDRVEKLMEAEYPHICYVKRVPSVDVLTHHNFLIKEACTEFVTFFHDDDIMFPKYAEELLKILRLDNKLAAVAPNAYLIEGEARLNKRFGQFKEFEVIKNGRELMQRYFAFGSDGYPPFPGYMYRTEAIRNSRLNSEEGGRHSDYSFLDHILGSGSLGWMPEVLMNYRIHQGGSGVVEVLCDRRSLVNYLCNKYCLSRKSNLILVMRYKFMKSWENKSKNCSLKIKWLLLKLAVYFAIVNSGFRKEILRKMVSYAKWY